ncbi:MAG: flippase-like domain-containing protein [Flavobacteriales bacterium]|nr:flippase-like domain-containing protein [Flavobacteriales bacterium]
MQRGTFDTIKVNQLTKGSPYLFRLFQLIVLSLAAYFLYDRLKGQLSFDDLRLRGTPAALALAIALMPLNWGLEAFKWKRLTKDFAALSLGKSLKSVWIGTFYTLFTPNRIGDGAGRIHLIPKGNKTRSTWAFLNGSVAQTLATLLFGSIALAIAESFITDSEMGWWSAAQIIAIPVWILTVIVLLLYVEPGWLRIIKELVKEGTWVGQRVATLQAYTRRQNAWTLFLSVLRYASFTFQFVLVFEAFGFEGEIYELVARISLVYLATTIIPTAALAELGIRESMAVLMIPAVGICPEICFTVTLIVWFINVLTPALIGAIFFSQLKSAQE